MLNSLVSSDFLVIMGEPADDTMLTSTLPSSSATPPVEREVFVKDWVTNEVLNSESLFTTNCTNVHTVVNGWEGATQSENDLVISIPDEDERVCSTYAPDLILMYKVVFRDMGFCVPFTDFQISIFNHLELAPANFI